MKNIISVIALTFAAILTAPAQSIYLDVQGPTGVVKPGDSFQLTYTLTWDEGFFTEDYRFIGIGVTNAQWPEYWGSIMMLTDVESHLSSDFELTPQTGWMNTSEKGFSLIDWSNGGGDLTPPVLTATVTYQTFVNTPEQQYIMALNLGQFSTWYATSDYEMHAFDPENVNLYVLTVSSVPEPSTYAAGIGIIALAAAAYARRKRSSPVVNFPSKSREAA